MATYEKILKSVVVTTKSGGSFTITDTTTTNDGSAMWEAIRDGLNLMWKSGTNEWTFVANDCICNAVCTVTTADVQKPEDEFCQEIPDPCAP